MSIVQFSQRAAFLFPFNPFYSNTITIHIYYEKFTRETNNNLQFEKDTSRREMKKWLILQTTNILKRKMKEKKPIKSHWEQNKQQKREATDNTQSVKIAEKMHRYIRLMLIHHIGFA